MSDSASGSRHTLRVSITDEIRKIFFSLMEGIKKNNSKINYLPASMLW